ncbi:MAG: DUF6152 family protein [Candidatus Rariloculaceae bacterium]
MSVDLPNVPSLLKLRVRHCASLVSSITLLALMLAAYPSAAHHANSAYDRDQSVTISGTVTRWQFINPHAGIWVEVTNDDGSVQEWAGEFQSVQDLYRFFSWNKDTFKPGDEVTLIGNPDRRPDSYSMWTSRVRFADGTEVDVRNTP